jgi:spore coat polysaccharide biosynthesis protein SpsF (cytidylyltransferase family)
VANRVVAIVQARTGSSRLPGKVLAPVRGRELLSVLLTRIRSSAQLDDVVVATSVCDADEAVVKVAAAEGVSSFRGSELDCLDRYYQAARLAKADVVVRLTADNPIVDAAFVDWATLQFVASLDADYASTELSGLLPIGLKAEVFTFAALETAWSLARDDSHREHVTPYLYCASSGFNVKAIGSPISINCSHLRWTVDTYADLLEIRRIFDHFGNHTFSWEEAAAVFNVRDPLDSVMPMDKA